MITAVIFDLDGVLVDSERLWDNARREVAGKNRGHWTDGATRAMQGMSSPEWSSYMHDQLGVTLAPGQIIDLVVAGLLSRYEKDLPLLPGAVQAVERVGRRWPLGLASSSNRPVIDEVLALAGLDGWFRVTVSSEEVQRGKPAPDVYLEAARRLGQAPRTCAAVEDSANGILSAAAAGMAVVAVPRQDYPPPGDVLARAAFVLESLDGLSVEALGQLGGGFEEYLDEEETESFPASDPHSDWQGRLP